LGIAQAINSPVVVCVTSGTALLNLLPAVAEAFYQHIPLIVVSADRPAQWINQLDGQTIPQNGALGAFVKKAINIPEFHDEEERWYCNRMINEALISCSVVLVVRCILMCQLPNRFMFLLKQNYLLKEK